MEHADLILALDKQQGIYSQTARRCANNDEHGRLTAVRTGQALVCGKCGYMEPAKLDAD